MRINRRQATMVFAAVLARAASTADVRVVRVPASGLQPQLAAGANGALHLLYFSGEPMHGDLFYVRSTDGGASFSQPLRVNSQEGSAVGTGTIRGGQIALGKNGRVHVAWNGSGKSAPRGPVNPDSGKTSEPMLYSRLNGEQFEPQRNLMLESFGLDGGGSLAADKQGNVWVAWHGISLAEAKRPGLTGEARRRVWLTRSEDDGRTFLAEARAWNEETGACGCCGMKLFASKSGEVLGLYRSATESVHRDIYLLRSNDAGRHFSGQLLHKWEINACPMSSMDFAEGVAAWETGGQVYWAPVTGNATPIVAPGEGKGRKHPRVAVNARGETLLVWTEGTGWQKGGGLAWQLFDRTGKPQGDTHRLPGIPAWSFAAVMARPDGGFTVLY